jgi:hypothetical protein
MTSVSARPLDPARPPLTLRVINGGSPDAETVDPAEIDLGNYSADGRALLWPMS